MSTFEVATIVLIPLALSMAYAFKQHNKELIEYKIE